MQATNQTLQKKNGLWHGHQVSTEERREPDDVIVKVQALDGLRKYHLVLARRRPLLSRELPHDELLPSSL